jgi:hypothetical protein
MVVVAGWSSSNQHRLWSSSLSTSTVVIIIFGIDCGHRRHWPWSSSSSTLSVVVVVIYIGCGRCRPWSSSTIMESRLIGSSSHCRRCQRSCACKRHRQRRASSLFAIVSSAIRGEGSGRWSCGGRRLQIGSRGSSKQSRSSVQSWV